MKVVAMLGSPHPHGVSSTVARRVLDGAGAAGHEVIVYELNQMNVRGCQGCRYCKENDADCRLEDDLEPCSGRMPWGRGCKGCGLWVVGFVQPPRPSSARPASAQPAAKRANLAISGMRLIHH